MNISGHNVLAQIKCIYNRSGYGAVVRDSCYREKKEYNTMRIEGTCPLERQTVRCTRGDKDGDDTCYFCLVVKTVCMKNVERESDIVPKWLYVIDITREDHNHDQEPVIYKKCLLAHVVMKAFNVKISIKMVGAQIRRYLGQKYGIKIHKRAMMQGINYISRRRNFLDEECLQLPENLMKISSDNPMHRVLLSKTNEDCMHSVA